MSMASGIMSGVGGLASYGVKRTQSKIDAEQAEIAAKQQELGVEQREADRKDRLANALASQNAMAGARGVAAFEGSPLTVLEDSIERERVATERDKLSTELSTLAIRSQAKIGRIMGEEQARLSLFQQGSSLFSSGFGGGK